MTFLLQYKIFVRMSLIFIENVLKQEKNCQEKMSLPREGMWDRVIITFKGNLIFMTSWHIKFFVEKVQSFRSFSEKYQISSHGIAVVNYY